MAGTVDASAIIFSAAPIAPVALGTGTATDGFVLTATGVGLPPAWEAPPGGGPAFPVGAVFIAVVSTNPATLLGYGTWSAFGAGRVMVGLNAGDPDFDTAEETGGAKTVAASAQTFAGTPFSGVINHTHPVTDPGHTHQFFPRSATTGAVSSIVTGTLDTSSTISGANQPHVQTATTGITTANPVGGVASITPAGTNTPGAATSVVQSYIVCYFWKRTA